MEDLNNSFCLFFVTDRTYFNTFCHYFSDDLYYFNDEKTTQVDGLMVLVHKVCT